MQSGSPPTQSGSPPTRCDGSPTSGLVLALTISCVTLAAAQQPGTLRGAVRDGARLPIAGGDVTVPNTPLRTATDAGGRYEISGVPVGPVEVRIRAVGYRSAIATTTVAEGQIVTLDFTLQASVIALDEVVVSGTGAEMERKQLGNTVATIRADAFRDAPVTSLSEALAAREPGVAILPSSGLAAEGARIRIRGNVSLIQPNEPVVYVDGVRVDNGGGFGFITAGGTGTGGAGTASRLDDINPEQIERIEILKGAAAATLYGSEASAGVIQIITKKGTAGRARFSARVDQGLSWYPADRIKPQAGFPRTQAKADTLQAIMRDFATTEDGGPITPYKVFWIPSVTRYYSTGRGAAYSAAVSGGVSDALYSVAARYTSELGPFHPTDQLGPGAESSDRKAQASMNVTLFPRDRLSIASGMMYTDARHLTPENGNNLNGLQSGLFNSKPERANCAESLRLGLGGPFGEDSDRPGRCAGPGNEWGSALIGGAGTPRESAQEQNGQYAQHFGGSMRAAYDPGNQRLKLDGSVGIDVTDTRDFDLYPWGYNSDNLATLYTQGQSEFGAVNNRQITADLRVNWTRPIGSSWTSQLTVGSQGTSIQRHQRYARGRDFPGPGVQVVGAASSKEVRESFARSVNLGVLGQEQIAYRGWAFLTVGARWDRNSAFGEQTSGTLYPKFSGSFVLSDMPGWNATLVSSLRLRGAYGTSGLQPGAYDRFTTFAPLASQLGPGIGPENLGNPNLKPEVTREVEGGAEIALFRDRLALDVTYWDRRTTDALVPKLFLPSGGFRNLQLVNIGRLEAHGWDLKLTAAVIDRPGFGLEVFANGAYLYQVVADMGGAAPIKVGDLYPRYRNYLKEGYAPGALFGVQLLQVCGQTQYARCLADGDHYPYDTNADGQPDSKAELLAYLAQPLPRCSQSVLTCFNSPTGIGPLLDDNDGDGDLEDHYLGKPTPDWQGAFGADVRLGRNLTVSTLFEYKAGNFQISNLTDGFRNNHTVIGRNTVAAAKLERDLEDPASTPEQRLQALVDWAHKLKELSPYSGLNLVEHGDFVRFRELGLTYTGPSALAQKLGFSNLTFNATGRNVLLWTRYSGIDPEMNAISRGGGQGALDNYLDAVDAWGFPLPRRFAFSVRLGF